MASNVYAEDVPNYQVFRKRESDLPGETPECKDTLVLQASQCGPVFSGPGAKRSRQLSRSQKESLREAKKYAVEQCIKSVLLKQTIVHQQQQTVSVQQSAQKQQALSLMCRIYVGSINFGIQEDTVKQAFLPFGPIKSISVPYDTVLRKHKGFAFIEYDIPEAASLAVEQMNGVMLGGFSIKVGRPSNMPQAKLLIDRIMEEAKFYNRVYVASIHQDLAAADLQSVFEAFGNITSCKLSSEPLRPSKHRGYGYIEYETSASVDEAVSAMNLFDLGGIHLRVGKCVTPPNVHQMSVAPLSSMPTASAIAAAAVTAKLNILDAVKQPVSVAPSVVTQPAVAGVAVANVTSTLANVSPPISSPFASRYLLHDSHFTTVNPFPQSVMTPAAQPGDHMSMLSTDLQQDSCSTAAVSHLDTVQVTSYPQLWSVRSADVSHHDPGHHDTAVDLHEEHNSECRVMVLENMVDADSVDDELEAEVADECSKFGRVTSVVVSSERRDDSRETPASSSGDVKVFVEFTAQSEMESAVLALNGRYFAGRAIIARPYHEQSRGS